MSIPAHRAALDAIRDLPGDHPSLALTRLLPAHEGAGTGGGKESLHDLLKAVVAHGKPCAAYAAAFDRWSAAMQARPTALTFTATLRTPLAIGLGNASPHEIGLTLHHTYGMPFLPGSALKGLCRRVLEQRAGTAFSTDQQKVLTGDTSAAGYVAFWDAWMEPAAESPFLLDTITVHHPGYYGSRGADGRFPTDFDDPVPNAFLSIRPGVRFLVAMDAPTPEWANVAAHLLAAGLTHTGLGGKTNAGYGYFECDLPRQPVAASTPAPAAVAALSLAPIPRVPDNIESAIQSIGGVQDASKIDGILRSIDKIEAPALRRLCVEALKAHLNVKKIWKPEKADKSWYKAVAERLERND